jgi:hypothetical protein
MGLLIVNFGLFTPIDVAKSVGVRLLSLNLLARVFLKDSYCLLVMFESAGLRVLIVNLDLFAPSDVVESTGIALAESDGRPACLYMYGQNFVSMEESS